MEHVRCPFCGARVAVGGDGTAEPRCPRCGAWTVPVPAHGAAHLGWGLETTMALEERAEEGPAGRIAFVRAPYAGEGPVP